MSNDHFNYTTMGYPGTGEKDALGPCLWINQGESEGLFKVRHRGGSRNGLSPLKRA
jgi:hypothetical protein